MKKLLAGLAMLALAGLFHAAPASANGVCGNGWTCVTGVASLTSADGSPSYTPRLLLTVGGSGLQINNIYCSGNGSLPITLDFYITTGGVQRFWFQSTTPQWAGQPVHTGVYQDLPTISTDGGGRAVFNNRYQDSAGNPILTMASGEALYVGIDPGVATMTGTINCRISAIQGN